jgi:hypothetical protein
MGLQTTIRLVMFPCYGGPFLDSIVDGSSAGTEGERSLFHPSSLKMLRSLYIETLDNSAHWMMGGTHITQGYRQVIHDMRPTITVNTTCQAKETSATRQATVTTPTSFQKVSMDPDTRAGVKGIPEGCQRGRVQGGSRCKKPSACRSQRRPRRRRVQSSRG